MLLLLFILCLAYQKLQLLRNGITFPSFRLFLSGPSRQTFMKTKSVIKNIEDVMYFAKCR